MDKTNIVFTVVILIFLGFYTYTVFLSDTALINRTEISKDEKGGYTVVTNLLNGSKLIETYEVTETGAPLSHTLAVLNPDSGEQARPIKSGTFIPKHKE